MRSSQKPRKTSGAKSHKIPTEVIVAVIGAISVILGAAISGIFALHNTASNQSTSNIPITPSVINATSTGNIERNPYSPYTGTLALDDPLFDKSLSMSKGYGWENYLDPQGDGCQFTKGGYHAIEQENYVNVCHLSTVVVNFAFEVQMEVIDGNCGGIAFRDDTIISAYHFEVCQDGTYDLYRYDSSNSHPTFASGSSSIIHTGLNKDNVIAVVAIGDKIDVYINNEQITTISDNKYQQGHVGLRVVGPAGEVIYINAKMWKL